MSESNNKKILNVPNLRFPEFKDEWNFSTLGSLSSKLMYGLGASAINFDGTNRYIRITDISNWGKEEAVSPSFIDDSALLKNHDILLARTGATVGDSFIFEEDGIKSYYAGFLIKASVTMCNPYFLYFQLKTNKYKKWVQIESARSGQPGLNSEQYSSYKISLASKNEQNKIVDLLCKINERIDAQNKIIEEMKQLLKQIRASYFSNLENEWISLEKYVDSNLVKLYRGNVIPKHEKDNYYIYPVYSSSIHNNGLMGFSDKYMFDKELVTWSIDGGGNFFYREKHKFNVTNVCGYIETDVFDYRFLSECLIWQHEKQKFDYQSKAHPSVISSIYKLPSMPLENQEKFSQLTNYIYKKIENEIKIKDKYQLQKSYLLQNLFI